MHERKNQTQGKIMIKIGRIYVKIAGRDAGKKCVIVEDLGKGIVMIDGETRRRKCNIKHLEPIETKIDIKKRASKEEVKEALKTVGIIARETKPKPKTQKPTKKKQKKTDEKTKKEEKKTKKPVKK